MPGTLSDALYERLLDAFPPHRPYPPAAFRQAPMPAPVAHFLAERLRRRLDRERADAPPSAWFDAAHPEVQQARQALADALARHGQFPAEAWAAALHEAVEAVTGYLERPAAALAAFVFESGGDAVSAQTVAQRMRYFSGYDYLHEAVRLYVERKGSAVIERADFAQVLRRIDRTYTQDFDADAWVGLLTPLFDLARAARPGHETVPLPVLARFFEDKDAEVVVERLQAARARQGLAALDRAGLRRLLAAFARETVTPAANGTPRPAAPAPAEAPAPASPAGPAGPVPLWKQFQQGAPPRTAPARPAPPPPAPAAPAPATPAASRSTPTRPAAGGPQPRWMQFRAPAEDAAPPPPPADRTALERAVLGEAGPINRALFVKHLFRSDADGYERVLRALYGAASWPEASRIIADEVFRKNGVNIYSEPAVLFTDAVEARFS